MLSELAGNSQKSITRTAYVLGSWLSVGIRFDQPSITCNLTLYSWNLMVRGLGAVTGFLLLAFLRSLPPRLRHRAGMASADLSRVAHSASLGAPGVGSRGGGRKGGR